MPTIDQLATTLVAIAVLSFATGFVCGMVALRARRRAGARTFLGGSTE